MQRILNLVFDADPGLRESDFFTIASVYVHNQYLARRALDSRRTLRILPPRNLEESFNVFDFHRHLLEDITVSAGLSRVFGQRAFVVLEAS